MATNKNSNTIKDIKALLQRANKNISEYKTKYKDVLSCIDSLSHNEKTPVTVKVLKELLSFQDKDNKVVLYDLDTKLEKNVFLDEKNILEINKTNSKSVLVRDLIELLDKKSLNDKISVSEKYSVFDNISNPIISNKSKKVILTIKKQN